MISKYVDKLKEGESLQADEAEHCLSAILESNLPDEQIAELLIAFSERRFYSERPIKKKHHALALP